MLKTNLFRFRHVFAAALLGAAALTGAARIAQAQEIVLSVNGSPITTFDIAQRMKLLRILKKPDSRQAAIDDLIADKLKLEEVSQFTIKISDSDVMAQGAQDAQEAHIPPAAFAQMLQSAGLDKDDWTDHFKAQAEWNMYVKAMNKTLDISDAEVDAAMAQKGQSPDVTRYLLRQIVVVVPPGQSSDAQMREAEQLRARFDGCEAGVNMVRGAPDVVVQPLISRTSTDVNDQVRATLDKTDIGHLTAPELSGDGVEMVAVCGKKTVRDSDAAGSKTRNELLDQRLQKASAALYAPLRARAVIVTP